MSLIIDRSSYAIGRSPGGWLQLTRDSVGRSQCVVSYDEEQDVHLLHDHGEKNPTLLNGAPLERPEPLADGDLITVGNVELEYLAVAPPGAAPDAYIRDMRQSVIHTRAIDQELPDARET